MLSLLLWVGFGAIIGWMASALFRDDDGEPYAPSVALGIVGAAIGGLLFHRGNAPEIFRVGSFATAFVGAVVLLSIANLATRGRVRLSLAASDQWSIRAGGSAVDEDAIAGPA